MKPGTPFFLGEIRGPESLWVQIEVENRGGQRGSETVVADWVFREWAQRFGAGTAAPTDLNWS